MIEYTSPTPNKKPVDARQIMFPSKSRALNLLEDLYWECEAFGRVSVARMHMLCYIPSTEADKSMGWHADDFKEITIVSKRGNCIVTFPKPVPIKPLLHDNVLDDRRYR